ncbi:hypothetical protein ACQKWADRAFT_295602 [Trichoderma austrokoningii]
MANIRVDIDPEGDTLIILPFVKAINGTSNTASEHDSETEEMEDDSLSVASDHVENESSSTTSGNENDVTLQGVYHFRVSMKHLSLAAARAKSVLQGPFLESMPTADGLRHWRFEPIFDPEAFKIVMSIIHTRFNNVPDQVSLEMLSNIAVIVDDLNCRDAVGYFAKIWIKEIGKEKLLSYNDGLSCARKIFISWVFGWEERFSKETHTAILSSPDISSSYGLPIPPKILDALGQKRLSMQQGLGEKLLSIKNELVSEDGQCFFCKSAAVGALVINIHVLGLSAEVIAAQRDTMTLEAFYKRLAEFKYPYPATCQGRGRLHVDLKNRVNGCLQSEFSGLDMSQY